MRAAKQQPEPRLVKHLDHNRSVTKKPKHAMKENGDVEVCQALYNINYIRNQWGLFTLTCVNQTAAYRREVPVHRTTSPS